MVVLDVDAAAVADDDEGGVELPDLVEHEVANDEADEVTLVVLNILLVLQDLLELLIEDGHPDGEDIGVLVEVFVLLIVFVLV